MFYASSEMELATPSCNPGTWEMEARRLGIEGYLWSYSEFEGRVESTDPATIEENNKYDSGMDLCLDITLIE